VVGSVSETGGWAPANITVPAGTSLHLRLTSSDVVHSFAVGQSSQPPVDILPGEYSQITLLFDKPGRYTYYCTRWCGPDHWRMRGVIDVTGAAAAGPTPEPPLFQQLGLDLDAPPPAYPTPALKPSARRGAGLGVQVPGQYLSLVYYRSHSPWQLYQALAAEPLGVRLDSQQLWDLTAWTWSQAANPESLAEGEKLYRQNCAACHGETGQGDGVLAAATAQPGKLPSHEGMAETPATDGQISGHEITAPADFTRLDVMLGRSPAALQGKIIRGGMGTGMPYWGSIFTDDQIWKLVDFLWTFVYDRE
jgi:mono/diheme cytochrome c family protein/plastocyanin